MATASDVQSAIAAMMASNTPAATPAAAPKKERKRGGLAGIWDRNKKIIKPVAAGAAGIFGGPAAAAAVGGLMGGLDREGKSGIGFDVGGGLKGAASGAVAGGVANMGKSALAGGADWFGAGKQAGADYLRDAGVLGRPASPGGGPFPAMDAQPSRLSRAASDAWKFTKANPAVVGAGLSTAGNMMASNQRLGMEQEQIRWERELFNRREQDRRRLAEQLRPLFLSLQNRLGGM